MIQNDRTIYDSEGNLVCRPLIPLESYQETTIKTPTLRGIPCVRVYEPELCDEAWCTEVSSWTMMSTTGGQKNLCTKCLQTVLALAVFVDADIDALNIQTVAGFDPTGGGVFCEQDATHDGSRIFWKQEKT
jgi:hypothetical protein